MNNLSLTQIRDDNEGAFTLVELLVVILIIGILAAIAIPAFLNQRQAAVDSSVQSDIKNAATQVETWMVSNHAADVPDFAVTADGVDTFGATDPATVDAINKLGSTIKISDGTELTIDGWATGTYRISGTNAGGERAAAEGGINYESTEGGIQK